VLLEHLFRHQAGRMVAHLTRLLGPAHLELAEETVQEAVLRALQTWPYQGVPENAAGWLYRVAHNIAIDAVRRNRTLGEKTGAIIAELYRSAGAPDTPEFEEQLRDDELRMIFMCCHPEIGGNARVALSLKTVGGFSVREIARAFLADDAAIAQRLVRAKRQIREGRLTLDMPRGDDLKRRLDSVLEVVYLMFNEGYAAHAGEDLIRQDLCLEALRLGRLIALSSIAEPRAHALVALMALSAARLPARVDASGDLVLLEDQDHGRWDQRLISLGFHHLDRSMAGEEVSEYHLQAAIAATHARAVDPQSWDWPMVLELYDRLLALNQSPGGGAESRGRGSQSARAGRGAGHPRTAGRRSETAWLLSAAGRARAPAAGTRPPRGCRRELSGCAGLSMLRARAPVPARKLQSAQEP
jgi:RNA polymerase sigma-70 factor (ECF subfamily)